MTTALCFGNRRRARSLSSLERITRLDDDLVQLRKRYPPPSGPEIDRLQYHIGLQHFGIELQKAATAIFPGEQKSRYTKVDVILLSWEDEDFNLPVSEEIKELDDIFTRLYGFDVEQWHIPTNDCHNKLQAKILQFLGSSDSRHLKIVYYAGHGKLTNHHQLAWTSWRNNGNDRCPTVKWSGIQNTLEESRSDVLILLDCCSSGICTADEGNGVTELIAACAYNALANPVGPYSFTYALNAKLRLLAQRPDFTIGVLYNAIFTEVQSQRHLDPRYKKAPVHLVLSQNQNMPRSIRLSKRLPPREKSGAGQISKTYHSQSNIPNNATKEHLAALVESPTPSTGTPTSGLSPSSSVTSLTSMNEVQQYPRLLFSIRIDEDIKTKDLSTELFADWLRDLPMAASLVRVEAGFASDSTLMMISMPVAMLGYLPSNPAITLLGTIRSQNLLTTTDAKSSAKVPVTKERKSSLYPANYMLPPTPGITPHSSFKIGGRQPKQGTTTHSPRQKSFSIHSQNQSHTSTGVSSPVPVSSLNSISGVTDRESDEDPEDKDSEGGTENSFIDDYSIGDNSDAETTTTYATTHDRSSITPVPRLFSATTRSESYFPRTPTYDRKLSLGPHPPHLIKSQDESLHPRKESTSSLPTPIPTVTISKWGSATPPFLPFPQTETPESFYLDKGKGKDDPNDADTNYIASWDKQHRVELPLQKLPAGIPPEAKHMCATCAASDRKTEVLWGDMCQSCGTNC